MQTSESRKLTWAFTTFLTGESRKPLVIGDSWFGSVRCAVALAKAGKHAIMQVKTTHSTAGVERVDLTKATSTEKEFRSVLRDVRTKWRDHETSSSAAKDALATKAANKAASEQVLVLY